METINFQSSQKIKGSYIYIISILLVLIFLFRWSHNLNLKFIDARELWEALFIILIITLLLVVRLKITVTNEILTYQFFLFHFSTHVINKNKILSSHLEKINPFLWGIGLRYNVINKTVGYILSGPAGIKLELIGGKKIVFSTDQPEKLLFALRNYSDYATQFSKW